MTNQDMAHTVHLLEEFTIIRMTMEESQNAACRASGVAAELMLWSECVVSHLDDPGIVGGSVKVARKTFAFTVSVSAFVGDSLSR